MTIAKHQIRPLVELTTHRTYQQAAGPVAFAQLSNRGFLARQDFVRGIGRRFGDPRQVSASMTRRILILDGVAPREAEGVVRGYR